MELAGGDGNAFDAIELYSCFPCVPKMARRTLGLGADVQPTVTGGLTFFGAPLNTYMTHAACAMVRKLRGGARLGLLYGQGGFVTKHHGLVLSRQPPREAAGAGYQRAGRGRPQSRHRARIRHRGRRQGRGREFYRDLRPRRRDRAWRGDAANRRQCPRAGAGAGAATSARWRICSTWTARRSVRPATSSPPMTGCWSGDTGSYGNRSTRSPDGAQRNPGICTDGTAPDCAALHPGYAAATPSRRAAPKPFRSCRPSGRRRGPGRRRRCRRAARQ